MLKFNHNCSVREPAFGLPLKNTKSFKRLPVVFNSLGFKRLNDLEKQLMYKNVTRLFVANERILITTNQRFLPYSRVM